MASTMPKFDLSTHVERSRKGPCFVCAYLGGHPDYVHEPVYSDDGVVAFLSQYPTLLGYTIVAPRPHVVDVTGDYKLFRQVTDVVHDVAEALKKTLSTERVYLMSLGSHQGNAHVHWHVVPLPPGVPYERQRRDGRERRSQSYPRRTGGTRSPHSLSVTRSTKDEG
jgi:diadenosine tetraphosphate (Ap4A) HIT family hydrolase